MLKMHFFFWLRLRRNIDFNNDFWSCWWKPRAKTGHSKNKLFYVSVAEFWLIFPSLCTLSRFVPETSIALKVFGTILNDPLPLWVSCTVNVVHESEWDGRLFGEVRMTCWWLFCAWSPNLGLRCMDSILQ